jgi:hypothetical protein
MSEVQDKSAAFLFPFYMYLLYSEFLSPSLNLELRRTGVMDNHCGTRVKTVPPTDNKAFFIIVRLFPLSDDNFFGTP